MEVLVPTRHRIVRLTLCCAAVLIAACTPRDEGTTADSAGGTPTVGAAGGSGTINLGDLAGNWDLRAVPVTGDTTATTYVLHATADTTGWTFTFPNRPPVPVRVRVSGDSVMTSAGPYESVRRAGLQVTTEGPVRLQGGMLVGTVTARYTGTGVGADSVMRFNVMGHRAP
jgi:hypothetical protein